ncbi:autoinducer binding domain-containing protein, partial [Pseudomonas helleri]
MGTANRFYTKQELTQKGESTLLTYARNRIELCGFDSFLFRMAPQQRSLQIDRKILTNHPTEFIDTFDACCITHKNPIENHFKKSIDPLVWDQQLF